MNTYHLSLDLDKKSLRPLEERVTLRQGDKSGCTIVADLYDHGERFTEAGLSATFVMDLPDKEHYYSDDATYDDGTVTITVDETYAASVPGITDNAYFEITDGDEVIASTQPFRVCVLRDARDGKTAGETYDTEIARVLASMESMISRAETVIEHGFDFYFDWEEDGSGDKWLVLVELEDEE